MGLLEIKELPVSVKKGNSFLGFRCYYVHFMHRTVFEFLNTPGILGLQCLQCLQCLQTGEDDFDISALLAFIFTFTMYRALCSDLTCVRISDKEAYTFRLLACCAYADDHCHTSLSGLLSRLIEVSRATLNSKMNVGRSVFVANVAAFVEDARIQSPSDDPELKLVVALQLSLTGFIKIHLGLYDNTTITKLF